LSGWYAPQERTSPKAYLPPRKKNFGEVNLFAKKKLSNYARSELSFIKGKGLRPLLRKPLTNGSLRALMIISFFCFFLWFFLGFFKKKVFF